MAALKYFIICLNFKSMCYTNQDILIFYGNKSIIIILIVDGNIKNYMKDFSLMFADLHEHILLPSFS